MRYLGLFSFLWVFLYGCAPERSSSAEGAFSEDADSVFQGDSIASEETADEDTILYNDNGIRLPFCKPACSDDEVCNPYGECICDSRKYFIGKYQERCIIGQEANQLFCNDHGLTYTARTPNWRGPLVVIEEKEELLCARCQPGWFGDRCDIPLENYPDALPAGSASEPIAFQKVKPYCTSNDDCPHGLVCGTSGYCRCEDPVSFVDPGMEASVREMLGLDSSAPITGEMLANLSSLLVNDAQALDDLRCMPHLRNLMLPLLSSVPLDPVRQLKHLQALFVLVMEPIDFSPIADLDRLLILHLVTYNGVEDVSFLKEMKSRRFITDLILELGKTLFPIDLSFLAEYPNLANLAFEFITPDGAEGETMKRPLPLSLLPHPEKLREIDLMGNNFEIDDPLVFQRMTTLKGLAILGPGSNIRLSQFPHNEDLVDLAAEGDMVDIPIKERFPRIASLTLRNAIERLDEKIEGLDLAYFVYSAEFDTELLFPSGIYRKAFADAMPHLSTIYFYPYYETGDIGWLAGKRYLISLLLQPWSDAVSFPPTGWDYPRDNRVYRDLLYLTDLTDYMGGIHSLDDFVVNCKNGGTLCRTEDYLAYVSFPGAFAPITRGLWLLNNPIDREKEEENLSFLSRYKVSVELDTEEKRAFVLSRRQFPFWWERLFR